MKSPSKTLSTPTYMSLFFPVFLQHKMITPQLTTPTVRTLSIHDIGNPSGWVRPGKIITIFGQGVRVVVSERQPTRYHRARYRRWADGAGPIKYLNHQRLTVPLRGSPSPANQSHSHVYRTSKTDPLSGVNLSQGVFFFPFLNPKIDPTIQTALPRGE